MFWMRNKYGTIHWWVETYKKMLSESVWTWLNLRSHECMVTILTLFGRFLSFSEAFWWLSVHNYPKVLKSILQMYHNVFWTFLKRLEYFFRGRTEQLYWLDANKFIENLSKGNKRLSNGLSTIPYMTRKISAILRVFKLIFFS